MIELDFLYQHRWVLHLVAIRAYFALDLPDYLEKGKLTSSEGDRHILTIVHASWLYTCAHKG